MNMNMKIETKSGIYEVKEPAGKLGAKHIALLSSAVPKGIESGMDPENLPPEVTESMTRQLSLIFEKWADEILPHIVISGPHPYEEMPGVDQYGIFLALISTIGEDQDFFRIV
jgi:hypothetical protein